MGGGGGGRRYKKIMKHHMRQQIHPCFQQKTTKLSSLRETGQETGPRKKLKLAYRQGTIHAHWFTGKERVRRDTGGTWESLDTTRLLMHTSGSKKALLYLYVSIYREKQEAAWGPEENHRQAACGTRLTQTAHTAAGTSDEARRPRAVSQNRLCLTGESINSGMWESLLLPLSIFPSIMVFCNESVLHIKWPEYWSFSFSISNSNEY